MPKRIYDYYFVIKFIGTAAKLDFCWFITIDNPTFFPNGGKIHISSEFVVERNGLISY